MLSGFTCSTERRVTVTKKEELMTQDVQNLSEKCRVALEKSYGFKIPVPKSIGKSLKEV
jgi:hypothetical protein